MFFHGVLEVLYLRVLPQICGVTKGRRSADDTHCFPFDCAEALTEFHLSWLGQSSFSSNIFLLLKSVIEGMQGIVLLSPLQGFVQVLMIMLKVMSQ